MGSRGWEAACLQGYLTGVTLTADWLIPCPLSHPMMLRGRIAPKVTHANTRGKTGSLQYNCRHAQRSEVEPDPPDTAWGIITFPFKLQQTCYSSVSQVIL